MSDVKIRRLITAALLCAGCCAALGQRPVGIAFYDVDRIYDTLPALFYDDADYTPEGRLHGPQSVTNAKSAIRRP